GSTAYPPSLSMDPGGEAMVVWNPRRPTSGLSDITGAHFTPSAGWGPVGMVATSGGTLLDGRVAFVAGHAVAIFRTSSASIPANLYTSFWTPAGGWTAPQLLVSGVHDREYAVAISAGGVATAAWLKKSGFDHNLQVATSTGSGWGTAVPLTTSNKVTALSLASAGGAALIGWIENWRFWSARYAAATGWSAPDAGPLASSQHPRVSMASPDDGIACWLQTTEGSPGARAWIRRRVSGSWEAPQLVEADAELGQSCLVLAASGRFAAFWGTTAAQFGPERLRARLFE
ncbi:MAG: hypothetical protein ACK4N5_27380, partial [Myxococcales bacterium]